MVERSVSILLCMGCPSTIPRCIIAVIINAIKRAPLPRRVAHIFIKSLECLPPITNFNAATAIMLIRILARLGAAFVHTAPGIKDRRVGHAMDCYKTPARMSAAVAEVFPNGDSFVPAITEALPQSLSLLIAASPLQNNKFSMAVSRFINNLRHNTPLKQMPRQSIPLFAKTLGLPGHELQFYRTSSVLARTVYHKYMNLSSGVDNAGFMVYHVTKSYRGYYA